MTCTQVLRAFLHHPDGARRPFAHVFRTAGGVRVTFDDSYVEDPGRQTLSAAHCGLAESDVQPMLREGLLERGIGRHAQLPAFFSNLLPEGSNRRQLAHRRGCSESDELDLLAAGGLDLLGALEAQPASPSELPAAVCLDALPDGTALRPPLKAAALIPGVVVKFSAIREGRRYVVKHRGQAGSYILKLPTSTHPDLVENEYTGYRLCAALHLDCAEAAIVSSADVELPEQVPFERVLSVKRFDRSVVTAADGSTATRRVHFEELCQALNRPPMRKYTKDLRDYAAMLGLLQALSDRRTRDLEEFVSRFVAFILMGNCDAHLKNWGFVYPDGRRPRLAPVYDPVCIAAMFKADDPNYLAHNRGADNAIRAFDEQTLETMLRQAALPSSLRASLLRRARETVLQARARWPAILADAPSAVRDAVLARLDGGTALTSIW